VEHAQGYEGEVKEPADEIARARADLYDDLLARDGNESVYEIRRELRLNVDQNLGVYRDEERLKRGVEKVAELKDRYRRIKVRDRSKAYNIDLMYALELGFMLDNAEVALTGALARTESRGGHARTDYTERDDDNWLKHTVARRTDDGPKLEYTDVAITAWKPVERKY
jgi:succinate dehydrogenase/fumarate reductase flavoprotein subunit